MVVLNGNETFPGICSKFDIVTSKTQKKITQLPILQDKLDNILL